MDLKTVTGPSDAVLDIPLGTGGRSETGEYSGAMLVDHSLIERQDGTLIACAYGWWKGDEEYSMLEKYVPEMNIYKTRVWVISSKDHGKTWQTLGTLGYWPELGPEGMGERIGRQAGGRCCCFAPNHSCDWISRRYSFVAPGSVSSRAC